MTTEHDDDLERLRSPSSIDRLRAARSLQSRQLSHTEVAAVRELQSHEVDAWVRRALDEVVARRPAGAGTSAQKLSAEQVGWPADPQALEDTRAQAILDVTQLLLHEMRPMLGVLEVAASRDVPEFSTSLTKERIERVRSFLNTVEKLELASRPPEPRDFDLTEAIFSTVRGVDADPQRTILARDEPVSSWGDWDLVSLCFANTLRNALEATADDGGSVVVNWGTTDRDSWITILDEGPGLPEGYDDLFKAGHTTKSRRTNHGWGLAIALQAIRSAGGEVALRPRGTGGAGCDIRWPIRGALL